MSKVDHPFDNDMAGRIMAIEQRLKGLQGRTAALEARLSSDGSTSYSQAYDAGDDFIMAMSTTDMAPSLERDAVDPRALTAGRNLPGPGTAIGRGSKRAVDITGFIAGGVLIGVGLLLYTGNFDLIKNPVIAMGCGILLMGSALRGLVL